VSSSGWLSHGKVVRYDKILPQKFLVLMMIDRAHAGTVGDVVWIAGDTHIVSIGAMDHIVMQWRCVYDSSKELGDDGAKYREIDDVERLGGHDFDDQAIVRATDSFGKIEQWRSTICSPSTYTNENDLAPSIQANMEHVHGIRLSDSKHALKYNANGDTVYIVGIFGVINMREQGEQCVYRGHLQAPVCLDVCSRGLLACSGEIGSKPAVHIWDACSAVPLGQVHNIHREGITCVAFNRTADVLVTLGQDPLNSIVVLRSPSRRWNDAYIECSFSTTSLRMLWVLYIDENPFPICLGGLGRLSFYRSSGQGIERISGVYGKDKIIQPLTCAAGGQNDGSSTSLLTGTVSGHLYEWREERIVASVTAHDMPVAAVATLGRMGYVSGAGDGSIKVWSTNLQPLYTINALLFSPLPSELTCHLLQSNLATNKLAVGFRSGEVYEVTLQTRSSVLVVQNHRAMQLHGLSCNPSDPDEFVTSGDDGSVIVWSIRQKVCLRMTEIDTASRAIAWGTDGRMAVGIGGNSTSMIKDGAFMIIDGDSLQILFEDRKSKLAITDVAWSKGDKPYFVISSLDGKVYLHDGATYDLLRVVGIPDSKATVYRVEISADSCYIRMSTSNDELFCFSREGGLISNPTILQDCEWGAYTCPYNWLTQGIDT
jgi:WD40 repeat protein